MTPEKQVALLETCKKLQELGIEIDSFFSWYQNYGDLNWHLHSIREEIGTEILLTPAPTAQELLDKLPDQITTNGFKYWLEIHKTGARYRTHRGCNDLVLKDTNNKNLAEALGLMILWLKENNHI
jgi:hypothetical protein